MESKPVAIRFDEEELDAMRDFIDRCGGSMTLSRFVRESVTAQLGELADKDYRTIKDIAWAPGEDSTLDYCQFLDDFAKAKDKLRLIEQEPVFCARTEGMGSLYAATAQKLAHDNGIPVPGWVLKREYIEEEPKYAFGTDDEDFQAYLRETTPVEFCWHNLYYGENVMTRK